MRRDDQKSKSDAMEKKTSVSKFKRPKRSNSAGPFIASQLATRGKEYIPHESPPTFPVFEFKPSHAYSVLQEVLPVQVLPVPPLKAKVSKDQSNDWMKLFSPFCPCGTNVDSDSESECSVENLEAQ